MTALYLLAVIAGQTVAIDATTIESVVQLDAVVPIPNVAPAIRGLAALRSRVVTVIDPRPQLGAPSQPAARAAITWIDGHFYAVLVDALEDVAPFEPIAAIAGFVPASPWRDAARGLVLREGEPVLVIDLAALVPGVAQAA